MSPAHKYEHMETTEDINPVDRIDWDNVECEAHYEAIDTAHLDDPYAQKILIGPCVVTGEIRLSTDNVKTPWPDMVYNPLTGLEG